MKHKKIKLLLTLLIPLACSSQALIGMGAGYSSFNKAIIDFQIGLKINKNLIYYNQSIPMSNADVPAILGLRWGYNIGQWQPFIGLDYHLYSTDETEPKQGWKMAIGLSKYFKYIPLKIGAFISGGDVIGSVGIYKLIN